MELVYYLINAVVIFLIIYTVYDAVSDRQSISSVPITEYLPGGSIYLLFRDPSKTYDAFARLTDRMRVKTFAIFLGPTRWIATADSEDILQVLTSTAFDRAPRQKSILSEALWEGLMTQPHDEHFKTRQLLSTKFNPSVLSSMHNKFLQAIDEAACYLRSLSATRTPFDFNDIAAPLTFRIFTNVAFGLELDLKARQALSTFVEDALNCSTRAMFRLPILDRLGCASRKEFLEMADLLKEKCEHILREQQARENGTNDLLDTIAEIPYGSPIGHTATFLVAGTHTTGVMLQWLLFDLLTHPDKLRKVEEEIRKIKGPIPADGIEQIPYTHAAWKESLRIHRLATFMPRVATKDTKLKGSGIKVRTGQHILILSAHAQKLDEYWNGDGKTYRPERWIAELEGDAKDAPRGAYLPFSIGQRNCAGKFFADHEGLVSFVELMRKFRFELACKPEEVGTKTTWMVTPYCSSENEEVRGMHLPVTVCER